MNKLFLFFLPFLFCAFSARADDGQNASGRGISLRLGADNFHLKDEYASPLIYRGTLFSASASYDIVHENNRQTIEADFGIGTLTSSPRQFDARHYLGSLSYQALFKVHTTDIASLPVELYAGGGVSTTFWAGEYRSNSALQPNDFGDGYAVHGLNAAVAFGSRLGPERSVMLVFASPLVRLVSRPEYGVISDRDNGFLYAIEHPYTEFFWEHPIVLIRAEYDQSLGDAFNLQAQYRFGFNACDEPLPMSAYSNTLVLGLQWKLR